MPPHFPTEAVIRVGNGRGFLLQNPHVIGRRALLGHVMVTAAHCLPHLPPPATHSYQDERMYQDLIGPLGGAPHVWCECLFVDPVADVAVLGQPDAQDVPEDIADGYEELMDQRPALPMGKIADSRDTQEMPARQTATVVWLLSIHGRWERCEASRYGRNLVITGPSDAGAPGTSGSPVLIEDGCVIGVVNAGGEMQGRHLHTTGTVLTDALPGWLLEHVLHTREG